MADGDRGYGVGVTQMGSTGLLIAGRYRLDAVLGRGGMGVVWSGVDTLLERPVAMKEIRLPPTVDDDERLRFQNRVLREARAAARLNHRSVVTVYDVVDEDEQPYIVMELVRAPSLAELVAQRGPLSPQRVAELGAGIAGALGSAHRQGIIHRDVKPGNVLVPESGAARLTDFGIASITDESGTATTQRLVGSPSYMSPEQATNGVLTDASDRWSLGSTLYYAVEGVPPFDRGEAIPTLTSILSDPPRPPERAGPLGPVLLGLLAKDPTDRPSDDDLQAQLVALAGPSRSPVGRPAAAAPAVERTPPTVEAPPVITPDPNPGPRPIEREHRVAPAPVGPSRALIGAAALLAVLVIGAAVVLVASRGGGGSSRASGGAGTPDTMASSTTGPPSSASAGAVPANWVAYRDPSTGFTISHPPTWSISTSGTRTDFRDPATGAYLRVDHISPPHADAAADWRAYEPAFAAANPGYQRIQITPTTFQGFRAATWEYTYGGGSGALHAVDLGFIVGSTYGFALNFQTPAGAWQQMQPEFGAFERSFRAPPG